MATQTSDETVDVGRTAPTILRGRARASIGRLCATDCVGVAPTWRDNSSRVARIEPPPGYVTTMFVALALAMSVGSANATPAFPALPVDHVDTTYPQQTGRTIFVGPGGDLQTALNEAQLGDTIILDSRGTYT